MGLAASRHQTLVSAARNTLAAAGASTKSTLEIDCNTPEEGSIQGVVGDELGQATDSLAACHMNFPVKCLTRGIEDSNPVDRMSRQNTVVRRDTGMWGGSNFGKQELDCCEAALVQVVQDEGTYSRSSYTAD